MHYIFHFVNDKVPPPLYNLVLLYTYYLYLNYNISLFHVLFVAGHETFRKNISSNIYY